MNPSDHDLLRSYATGKSDAAFAELVRRHVDLVYSAARRQVRSAALAEDVAQSVFVDLARAAENFRSDTPVVAWLHLVARRTAIDAIRQESRRQAREKIAVEISAMPPSPSLWTEIEPLLDEALEKLSPPDRAAILLRFFENKNLQEVGAALGTSEDAAQKRVSRTLEQLRKFFLQRGIAVGAAGLTAELSAHAILTAPAALSGAIATSATLGGAALFPAAAQTAQTLATATLKKILVASALVAVVGGGMLEARLVRRQENALSVLRPRMGEAEAELRQLRLAKAEAARLTTSDREELAHMSAARATPDLQLDPVIQAWLARIERLKSLIKAQPTQAIPELTLLTEQDWFDVTRDADLDREEGVRQTFAALRIRAKISFSTRLFDALVHYADASEGSLPDDIAQLAPWMGPDFKGEILTRYELLHSGKLHEQPAKEWLIDEKSPLDETYDQRLFLSIAQQNTAPFTEARPVDFRTALHRFALANSGRLPAEAGMLLPYFPTTLSAATARAFLEKPAADFTPENLDKILRPE